MEGDVAEKLPYRAEYAKSGRSNCKACKTSIEKGALRLACMVQSPLFDGTVPNWYHFICFFTKQRPKSVGDIAHFDSLRWDDQEKLKAKLMEASGAPITAKAGKKASKRGNEGMKNPALKDFKVEYAKSSRAMCRGCDLKLSKGEVRISKKDFESENARMYGGQDRWHHVECFVKLRTNLEFYESGALLPGLNELKAEDQKTVKDALPKIDPPATVKDETDGPPPEKKKKESNSTGENEEMKKQNKTMYKYRDSLKALTKTQLTQLLVYNNQEDPVGTDRKLDRLADVMTFGALLPCEACKGNFVYRTGVGYQCQGDISEWSKCEQVEQTPKRTLFKVPEDLANKFPFLEKYKCKIGNRIILDVKPTVSSESVETNKVERFAPFRNMVFFLVGKTPTPKAELKKKLEMWGGKVASKLTTDVVLVISTKEEVDRLGSKMEEVKELNIPVVPELYIEACSEANPIDKISEQIISPWGNDPKARIQDIIQKSSQKSKSSSRFTKKSASKVKLKVKDGSAVDPDSGLVDIAHVYKENNDTYNCILGLSDVQSNKNSYYKFQLLVSDSGREFFIWRAWGRIGTNIGGNKLDKMPDIQTAKREFKALFEEKTGNRWKDRENFEKKPKLMYPIEVDYGQSDTIKMSHESSVESKLPKPVQDLVAMLFDVEIMKKVMMEFELDLEKMPLGKLSRKQIQKAYAVLSELQQKDCDLKKGIIIDATNRFYTIIPHDFGTDTPPLLDNKEIIQAKLEMLESLMEMEVAYSLLKETKGEGDDSQHPLDAHYKKLNTDIEVLDRLSDEFKIIENYVKNTHAETHSNYKLEIMEIFKAKRNGEDKRYKPFKKLPNKKLLWHGSRITNFVGILSQGLRIAPPEAPVTGYMFGKGVYFADMVSKSANYCMTSIANPEGLLLLCEVALGNMYERTHAEFIEKLPSGKHSTKGVGATQPDPTASITTPEGVEIPLGKGVQLTDRSTTSLLYNEYIVYDVAQVKVQYLLKMKFNYN
ncbi:poly [ADP-ribose] polymerase [Cimex lectularius]|uniref:Poly [ADP-ribose] polymerase n=1 Tax=Cimex lectularius TaxID=79782 RepID=A0A8I6RX09_CIMLE|nr:poly [ADP-ribose] polymerase [Cimex lectularius]